MPLLRFGGTGDRHVVILHATGFLAAAYQPLAAALQARSFVVWGLDLPGHGTAADVLLPADPTAAASTSTSTPITTAPISLPAVIRYITQTLQQAGLQGCYAFGHSAGGALALLAAASTACCAGPQQLFSALYCFEAVVSTPATHAFMAAATASGAITTDGQVLGSMARKRRATFGSRQAALQHLISKPPFSRLHPTAVALYVQHGLRPVAADVEGEEEEVGRGQRLPLQQQQQQQQQQQRALPQGQPHHVHQQQLLKGGGGGEDTGLPQQQHHQQQHQQEQKQQQDETVQLVCSPEQEAAYFDALQPPPSINPGSVQCPVLLAVAAPAAEGRDMTPAAALATHEGAKAWFYEHCGTDSSSGSSSGSSKRQLHGLLRVLNCELAAAMPTAQLLEIEGVSHFGPLEQPERLADSCAAFFLLHEQEQRQVHPKL